jgi:hypothetical protein
MKYVICVYELGEGQVVGDDLEEVRSYASDDQLTPEDAVMAVGDSLSAIEAS